MNKCAYLPYFRHTRNNRTKNAMLFYMHWSMRRASCSLSEDLIFCRRGKRLLSSLHAVCMNGKEQGGALQVLHFFSGAANTQKG